MSFALSTVIVLFLLIPGVFFRQGVLSGPYAKSLLKQSPVDEVFYALLPALVLQALAISLLEGFFSLRIDFHTFYQLIISEKQLGFADLEEKITDFALYNLALVPFSYFAGYIVRQVILKTGLDLIIAPLKLNNDWYYILSGRGQKILEMNHISSDNIYIQIDALVKDVNGQSVIYCGILDHFMLSQNGGLERIVLTKVYRRSFDNDLSQGDADKTKEEDERYYNMPGVYFIIPYAQIINMNIFYKAVLPREE